MTLGGQDCDNVWGKVVGVRHHGGVEAESEDA
jgi:hypothetical protein